MKDGRIDVLWNSKGFRDLRQAFLDGEKPKECHQCWEEEEAGLSSMRQGVIKDLDLSSFNFTNILESGPKALDLKLSNVCNLKCRICGPTASSTLYKEHKKRYGIRIVEDRHDWEYRSDYWLENKFFDTNNEGAFIEWLKGLEHLEITGGEPMSSPENIKLLKTLDSMDLLKNITFLMNTNTTIVSDRVLQYIKKFKKAQILLSIDDIAERYEYQRYPANFSLIEENIKSYKNITQDNPNVMLTIIPTISNFNIFYLEEIYNWIVSQEIKPQFNILHYTSFNCIKNLPKQIKDILVEKYKNSHVVGIQEILNFLNQPSESELDKFLVEVGEVDKIRNQKFETVFPDWHKLLNEYSN
jgi:sulfatase maturation enzyme AslB (radical SAM superfamily)